jgi:hypothetical protein
MELSNEYRRKRYPANIAVSPSTDDAAKSSEPRLPVKKPVRAKTTDKRRWASTEATISFDFNNLVEKVKKHIKDNFPELSSEEIIQRIGHNLQVFTINNQKFEYTNIPNKLGGVRWFVLCPKCGKKSQKLFLPKNRDREPLYLCRWCHKLKPSSLLLGKQKRYTEVAKPLKRLEYIKKRLLNKRLRTKEVEELLEEFACIEKKLADSPEYRLWKFKKEYGRDP